MSSGKGQRASRVRSPRSSAILSPSGEKPIQNSSGSPFSEQDPSDFDFVDEDREDFYRHRGSSSSRRTSSIPLAPPSLGSHEEKDDEFADPKVINPENILGGWHFAPLLIAILPPLGALIGGKADAWSDAILLFLAAFWLYQFLKVPHDIYHTARTRRILHSDALNEETLSPTSSPTSESNTEPRPPGYVENQDRRRERETALAELRRTEAMSLLALVLSPLVGAWTLHWLMDTFTDGNRYLNTFNIRLFMLASGIKPWTHAFSLLRRRLLHLQEVVHYPSSRVEHLSRRLTRIESDMSTLRKLVAMKTDVNLLKEGIDLPLTQLSRTMRRYEKKEEHLRMSAEDKFELVESRLEDLLREVAINAELIEEERREREHAASLPASMFQAIRYALGQRSQNATRQYIEGPNRGLPSSAHLNITAGEANGALNGSHYKGNGSSRHGSLHHTPSSSSDAAAPPSYSSPPRYLNGSAPQSVIPSSVRGSNDPAWHEEGLYYWMFLPLNLPKSAFRIANEKVRGAVTDVTDTSYERGYQTAARQANNSQRQQKLKAPLATAKQGSSLRSKANGS